MPKMKKILAYIAQLTFALGLATLPLQIGTDLGINAYQFGLFHTYAHLVFPLSGIFWLISFFCSFFSGNTELSRQKTLIRTLFLFALGVLSLFSLQKETTSLFLLLWAAAILIMNINIHTFSKKYLAFGLVTGIFISALGLFPVFSGTITPVGTAVLALVALFQLFQAETNRLTTILLLILVIGVLLGGNIWLNLITIGLFFTAKRLRMARTRTKFPASAWLLGLFAVFVHTPFLLWNDINLFGNGFSFLQLQNLQWLHGLGLGNALWATQALPMPIFPSFGFDFWLTEVGVFGFATFIAFLWKETHQYKAYLVLLTIIALLFADVWMVESGILVFMASLAFYNKKSII